MPANVLDQMVHDISAEPISIPLALLQDITENFADERKIGQGGFGVVYKVIFLKTFILYIFIILELTLI
jgi:hypothetical protein